MLSLANVSMLVLDSPSHGYYIHGKSVHSYSDTNMEELNRFLKKEEGDLAPRRGLRDTNQQSFEIFITLKMRATFDQIHDPKGASVDEVSRTNNMLNRLSPLELLGGGPSAPIRPATDAQVKQYKQINRFLKSFLDLNLKENPYTVREKTYFERFLTLPDPSEGNVFFHDETGFGWVLLYGIEWHMLTAYAFLYVFIDISSNLPILAAAFVWIIDMVVVFVRKHFGESNISRKTYLDWKFLI